MDNDLLRAASFVNRLLANPALAQLPPLQREEQIIQFLNANAQALYPTLSSPQFLPGKNWATILTLLTRVLTIETDKLLLPQLHELLDAGIDFTFMSFLHQLRIPSEKYKEEIFTCLQRLLQKGAARTAFSGPFTALSANLTDRYIDESFELRHYIHFELTKVQKLKMSKKDIKNMVKVSMLLKTIIFLLTVEGTTGSREKSAAMVGVQFIDKAYSILKAQLKLLPDALFKSALNSNVSFQENKNIEATGRIASIFSFRAQSYKPGVQVDRGANTPDRSWFNIARRNFKFYGFDIKMLDEFYKIAAENGW